jgi:hypothetical protein
MTDDTERICHGCHDPPPDDVELRTFRMEYGGTETLCPDCVEQSLDIIEHEVE